jgi:hypothetical protein
MGKYDFYSQEKFPEIFNDEERAEIWAIIKQAVSGKISKQDVENYVKALEKAIRDHGE